MRMVMHSFQAPRWVAPLLVIIAIALIPFALILALVLAGLAVGFSVLRLFLSGHGTEDPEIRFGQNGDSRRIPDDTVIDADFEVKNEKENFHRQDAKDAKKNI
jgi:hypothetical protein